LFFYVHLSVLLSVSVLRFSVFAVSAFWRINVFIIIIVPHHDARYGNFCSCAASLWMIWSVVTLSHPYDYINKKLSCHREAARCFMSLNISLNYSRSLMITGN